MALTIFSIACFAQQRRFMFSKPKMGSPFTIVLYHHDSAYAERVSEQAFLLVDSLVNVFSNYIDNSELNRLNKAAGNGDFIQLSPDLYDILVQSAIAYKKSHHSFDITIGPLTDLWRSARKENKFPDAAIVKKTRSLTGFKNLKIRRRGKTASLRKPGMRLDLGGIAQGYIAQKVLRQIQAAAISSVLVDVSGDIAMGDPPPGKKGWTIGVNLPDNADALQDKKLSVDNISVSTSGDVYQYMIHEGKKYSHIIDPRTGYGVTEGKNVTVIAANATTADWLATACSILPNAQAKRLVNKMKAALMIAYMKDGKLVIDETKGFDKYRQ